MYFLHASLWSDQLVLWAERETAKIPSVGRVWEDRARGKRWWLHPYAAEAQELSRKLQQGSLREVLVGSEVEMLCAWLPTYNNVPLPSQSRVLPSFSAGEALVLRPWCVEVLVLDWWKGWSFLQSLQLGHGWEGEIWPSAEVLQLGQVVTLVGRLLAQQRFVPSISLEEAEASAVWSALFYRGDKALLSLKDALPAAFFALSAMEDEQPPVVDRRACLERWIGDYLHLCVSTLAEKTVELAPPLTLEKPPSVRKRVTRGGVPVRGLQKPAILDVEEERIHERWLRSLCRTQQPLKGGGADLISLRYQANGWLRPLRIAASSVYRLVFQLVPPDEEGNMAEDDRDAWEEEVRLGREVGADARAENKENVGLGRGTDAADDWTFSVDSFEKDLEAADDWTLRLLARHQEESSVLLPLSRLVKEDAGAYEYAMSALGRVTRLDEQFARWLEQAEGMDRLKLKPEEAAHFLTVVSELLQRTDVEVLLPAWWRKGMQQRLKAKIRVDTQKNTGSGISLEQMMRFRWEVALGDQALTLEELKRLASLKREIVKLRGRWVWLDPEELKEAAKLLRAQKEEASLRELLMVSLGAELSEMPLPVDEVVSDGWLKEIFSQFHKGASGFAPMQEPQGFVGALRPYQQRGLAWLCWMGQWGLGACLADDMGLGKTIQTLAMLQHNLQQAPKASKNKPSLLICPMSVLDNWQREAGRFTPKMRTSLHHGASREEGKAFFQRLKTTDLLITTYGTLLRDIEMFSEVAWRVLILDEAQAIKNHQTKTARAAASLKAEQKLSLTGTPVENHVFDLWSQMHFLNPGLLGNREWFNQHFYYPIQLERDPKASQRLKRISSPFVLRRLKTDKEIIDDLPDKIESKVYCHLTKEQVGLYEAALEQMAERIAAAENPMARRGLILSLLTQLKQICNHPAHFLKEEAASTERSGKLLQLDALGYQILEREEAVLLFTQYTEMGALLVRYLEERFHRKVLYLHGGITRPKRTEMVASFQRAEGPPFFVLSLKAGGTGLNLTRASHVIHYDRWWNPAVENQATDRAFRIGQTQKVQVHKFVCVGTFEEKLDEAIERKVSIAKDVISDGEGWLTELSDTALRDVFRLRGTVGKG